MPHRNRVMPTGEFLAVPQRGTFMGNRGVLHDAAGRIGPRRWAHRNWVTCALAFKGRQRQILAPRRYTELFFWDEAVSLAAGHRPCAECRRPDYRRFVDAWEVATGDRPTAAGLDRMLHAARLAGPPRDRVQRRYMADIADLPTGTFVLDDGTPCLVRGTLLWPYGPEGYGPARSRPERGEAEVLTPAPIVSVLRAGYAPALHPSIG